MNKNNIVIGIEGKVGAGKTSICKELIKHIPNSIILHGGNIYRAIVCQMLQSEIKISNIADNMKNVDVLSILKKLGLEIKLENRETVIYINNRKISEEELQSNQASIAVSMVSNVADNSNLYEFGKKLIDKFRDEYNVILSSRDIMKMYPDTTYHFFITADLDERVNRKYIQYNKKISKEKIKETIEKRDELQEKSGYYEIYNNTKMIDVTNCKTLEESTNKVLENIKLEIVI